MARPELLQTDERSEAGQVDAPYAVAPRRVARMLFLGMLVLVVLHLVFSINALYVGYVFPGSTFFHVLFDLHGEVTIPTWFSSMLLLLCSLVLGGITAVKMRAGDGFRWHWAGLAALFLAFSAEESADVHGAVSYKLQNVYETQGALAYPWVIPAAIFTVAVGVVYVRFLWNLEPRYRMWFLVAAGFFVGGALGLELVEAAWDSARGDSWEYFVMVTIEETMEMTGAIIFLTTLLSYLGSIARPLRLDFGT